MYAVIFASVLNVVLNYYAIPNYGVFGAAIVSLITNVFVGILYMYFTRPLFYEWLLNLKVIVTLVFSAMLTIILWIIKDIYVFYSSPILMAIFLIVAYFYFFSDEEKSIIFSDKFKFINLKIK
jgi:O-antigen/teichoic acid export membrane protein